MWVRSAAIRPVPAHAQLPAGALGAVEEWLGSEDIITEQRLNELFERFEREQPVLAERVGGALARSVDEVAVALGYFLSLVIWLAFDNTYGVRLQMIGDTSLDSVEEALALDEKLRGEDPGEALDSDAVIAMEQPHVLSFVNEHIDAALDVHAHEVDVEAVHTVYRLVLVEVLALSYAVAPPTGYAVTSSEVHA